MTKPPIRAAVVIPCRNEAKYISAVLDALSASTEKNIEIVVVDGMSDDGTRTILAEKSLQDPRIRMIDNVKKITPVAFNLGIKNSSGEFVFIVGARHIVAPDYLATCIRLLQEQAGTGCVGGKVSNIFENRTSELISKAMSSPFAVGAGNFRIKTADSFVDTVGTPCYRRSIFDEVGYFDEMLLRNQDDDFNFRVTKKGYKILFTVQSGLSYYVRASFKNLFRQFMQYGYWKVFVNRKHGTITTGRQLVPAMFILYLVLGPWFGFLHYSLWLLWAGGLLLYLFASLLFAIQINGIAAAIPTAFCFGILHISYGWGYLQGIFDFLILRKQNPAEVQTGLSR